MAMMCKITFIDNNMLGHIIGPDESGNLPSDAVSKQMTLDSFDQETLGLINVMEITPAQVDTIKARMDTADKWPLYDGVGSIIEDTKANYLTYFQTTYPDLGF